MNARRRTLLALAGLAPLVRPMAVRGAETPVATRAASPLVLSNFDVDPVSIAPGARWRGFSDRVMGGVSDAAFTQPTVAGKGCIRLKGHVTTDSGGGFVQMALDLGARGADFDGAAYAGVEMLVHGNDEDYNVHVRTADCGWYDQSYRATFRAERRWQTVRLPWTAFAPNGLDVPLDPSRLQRIAVLGWMRVFEADIALAELALYV
jgi:hypothetical protein